MRDRPLRLMPLLVAVALSHAAMAAVAAPSLFAHSGDRLEPQDDAGSGNDAPNRFEEGLRLPPGTYEGRLGGLPAALVRDPVLDAEDWYRFHVASGDLVTLEAERIDEGSRALRFELRRPDAALAAWTFATASESQSVGVVADATGWWAVRSLAFDDAGGAYRFTLTHSPAEGFAAAHADAGAVALAFRVEPGGRFEGTITLAYAVGSTPARDDVHLLRNGAHVWTVEHAIPLSSAGIAVEARAPGVRADLHADRSDDGFAYGEQRVVVTTPGTYHVVMATAAREVYASIHHVVTEDAEVLGFTRGTLHALRETDFAPKSGVAAGVARAGILGEARVDVQDRLVGSFYCGLAEVSRCSVEDPDGVEQAVAGRLFAGAGPGTWTLRQAHSAAASTNPYAFLAADVALVS